MINTSNLMILGTIIVYLCGMLFVGAYFSKKGAADTSEGFYIGGRKLGPLVTAMSAEASDMSSWLLMGLPGLAYLAGVAEAGWTAIGLAVGTYLNWLIVARILRRYSERLGAITVPDFFARRYGDERHTISLICAIIVVVFFVPYTASGFKAIGTLFNSLFGIDYHIAMLIGALIVVGYTVLGGFLAVSTTDLIQSIVMTIALIAIVLFGVKNAGGMDVVMTNAKALPGYLNIMQGHDAASNSAMTYGFLPIVSTLAWGLGYFGMPHILLRFMAIRDEKELKTSRRIASVWVVISMGVAIFIGIVGYSVSLAGKIPMFASSSESETVIIQIAGLMSRHSVLFAILAGIILAGIMAATMSTADSQLLAAASSVSQDILQDFGGKKLTQKQNMLVARLTVIGIAVIGFILAWNPNSSVFRVVSFAWAGFGATFGPTMLLALYWKRSNKAGTLAGLVVGGVMVFVWKFLIAPMGGALAIYELLPAFILALIANIIVSLATKAPDKAIVEVYEEVHNR